MMVSSAVSRIWGIWGSYSNLPKAIFHLLKGTMYGFLLVLVLASTAHWWLYNVVALQGPSGLTLS